MYLPRKYQIQGALLISFLEYMLLITSAQHEDIPSEKREYCNMETLNITCGRSEVILTESARYGRMQMGRCVKTDLGYLGCSVDVLSFLDETCSGRRHCTFLIPHHALFVSRPCPEDTTSYLEVVYKCIPVATATYDECTRDQHVMLTQQSGYIASDVTRDLNIGSRRCPWIISMQSGQRMQVTLYSFEGSTTEGDDVGSCYEFGVIREQEGRKSLTTCDSNHRETVVYVSRSSEIEVEFSNSIVLNGLPNSYLLHYEAIGCPILTPPRNAWLSVDRDNVVVRCNFTEETWFLTCQGNKWLGTAGNCSTGAGPWNFNDLLGDGSSFPYGILIVVAIGVALGVFIGGVLLTLVVVYLRRRHRPLQQNADPDGPPPLDPTERGTLRSNKYRPSDGIDPRMKYNTVESDYGRGRGSFSSNMGTYPRDQATYPRNLVQAYPNMDRDSGFAGSTGFKNVPEECPHYEREADCRSHIYESPHFT